METLSNDSREAGMVPAGRSGLQPVREDGKGAIPLDDAPHHADLLRPEELQR